MYMVWDQVPTWDKVAVPWERPSVGPPGFGVDVPPGKSLPLSCVWRQKLELVVYKILLLERRQLYMSLVLLALGEVEIGVPCSFLMWAPED